MICPLHLHKNDTLEQQIIRSRVATTMIEGWMLCSACAIMVMDRDLRDPNGKLVVLPNYR